MKNFWKILVIMIGVGLNCLMFYGRVMAEEITGISDKIPDLYIKAINPGYVVDGKNNVGEMIEIARRNSDTPISLAGATVGYTNSSGNYSVLYEFPENSWITGESILLRLASSPESELAAVNYTPISCMRSHASCTKCTRRNASRPSPQICWFSF